METPVGVFDNCRAYEVHGEYLARGPYPPYSFYATTYFFEGIGMIRQDMEIKRGDE